MGAVTEGGEEGEPVGEAWGSMGGGDRGCGEQVVRRGQRGKVLGRAGHRGGARNLTGGKGG